MMSKVMNKNVTKQQRERKLRQKNKRIKKVRNNESQPEDLGSDSRLDFGRIFYEFLPRNVEGLENNLFR